MSHIYISIINSLPLTRIHVSPPSAGVTAGETERARPAAATISHQRPELLRLADNRHSVLKSDSDRSAKGARGGEGRGCTQFVHCRSRMTIDPPIPAMPGRSTSGFHQSGRHLLAPSAKRREMFAEWHEG